MGDFFCTRCLTTEEQVWAILGEGIELPPLGFIRNPLLTECCKDGWDPLPPRGKQRFRIALMGGYVSRASGLFTVTGTGTLRTRDFRMARLWEERSGAEQWIREHPLERSLRPRIEELDYAT